jgi:methylated-DNA-[protein]-cysteine S-methyltransferase
MNPPSHATAQTDPARRSPGRGGAHPNPSPMTSPIPTAAPTRPGGQSVGGPIRFTVLESPVGELLACADTTGAITGLHFRDRRTAAPKPDWISDERPFAQLGRQLDEYFAGELHDFDLELAPSGSPFQLDVWEALRAIPYGQTASYGEVAATVGQPGAARAVGGANNRNPIAIVVPCHRVIGASGSLTGYGGGLDRKQQLLALESGVLTLA